MISIAPKYAVSLVVGFIKGAAPVLTHSDQLDDEALVENARTKSQGHLLAISGRITLVAAVTDVLVDRGNQFVLTGTARNLGAAFSDFFRGSGRDGRRRCPTPARTHLAQRRIWL
jgi:hypothetical protein